MVWRDYPGYREPDTFDIVECPACRTRAALPLDVDASAVYEAIYHQADRIPGYDRYVGYAAEVARAADPLADLADREPAYWGIRKAVLEAGGDHLRILEVGSGLGYLTFALRRAGHDATGLDISAEAVKRARDRFGPHYEATGIDDHADAHPGAADIVIATEVIEHLADPLPFLDACLRAVRPGGPVLVTTPDRDCYAPHVAWAVDSPPVHLLWLTRDGLEAAARRLGASVSLVDIADFPGAGAWRLRSPRRGRVKPPILDALGRPRGGPGPEGGLGRSLRSLRKRAAARLAAMTRGGTPGPSPTLCAALRRC